MTQYNNFGNSTQPASDAACIQCHGCITTSRLEVEALSGPVIQQHPSVCANKGNCNLDKMQSCTAHIAYVPSSSELCILQLKSRAKHVNTQPPLAHHAAQLAQLAWCHPLHVKAHSVWDATVNDTGYPFKINRCTQPTLHPDQTTGRPQ